MSPSYDQHGYLCVFTFLCFYWGACGKQLPPRSYALRHSSACLTSFLNTCNHRNQPPHPIITGWILTLSNIWDICSVFEFCLCPSDKTSSKRFDSTFITQVLPLKDLTVAFGSVAHSILLSQLESCFRIKWTILKWFHAVLLVREELLSSVRDFSPLSLLLIVGFCKAPF